MSTGLKQIVLAASLLLALAGFAHAAEPPPRFIVHETPRPVPSIAFKDGEGHERTLAEFRDKVVLLNVWATWCAPCRKEMPTLDRLEAMLGGPEFEVVALSIDRAGLAPVAKFFGEIGVSRLGTFIDESGKVVRELGAYGLPITILIDRDGREIGRLVGPAEWDAPEMVAFLRSRIEAGPATIRTSVDHDQTTT
jgi:thiol-disulfide isomerase/thioredoxin